MIHNLKLPINDIEWFGRTKEDLFKNLGHGDVYQPVVVLSKK
jgi:hypothetical protein